ncbi:hypothetical protein FRB91_003548 [Serendipita sp. 411]|nr:hypothetical protein FRC19_008849 [Serendipita sp. 401]KAG8843185.1 hypothetical protein FRB91_003548 [Serendipita sp. 411]KAG9021920.1 hypothetical protein FS842_006387 [Serendipita sp. 407]
MESTVDIDLPLPETGTTGISALVNSMVEDGNSDYSDPPLFVTSSQCNSPALSSSSFATDQEQLATLSISRFDLLLESSTAGNDVTLTVKRSISLARHYAEFPLPIVRNLFAICFALEKIQLAVREIILSTDTFCPDFPAMMAEQVLNSMTMLGHVFIGYYLPYRRELAPQSPKFMGLLVTVLGFSLDLLRFLSWHPYFPVISHMATEDLEYNPMLRLWGPRIWLSISFVQVVICIYPRI